MFYSRVDLFANVSQFLAPKGGEIVRELGHGTQGIVYETSLLTAIKAYANPKIYTRERNVYLRLEHLRINRIQEFSVPSLSSFDDDQLLIEISIVRPPYLLDFGGAYLDSPPDHFDRGEQWAKSMLAEFGQTNWPRIHLALNTLELLGIFVVDINSSNINWGAG